jgi:hypothetical protein
MDMPIVGTFMPIPSVFGMLFFSHAVFPCCLHPEDKSLLHPDRVNQRLNIFISEVQKSQDKNTVSKNLPFVWYILRPKKKSNKDSNCCNAKSLATAIGPEQ